MEEQNKVNDGRQQVFGMYRLVQWFDSEGDG
jgi:hypothetical protein